MKTKKGVVIGLVMALVAMMLPITAIQAEAAETENKILVVNEDNVEATLDLEVTEPITLYSKFSFEEDSNGYGYVSKVINYKDIDESTGEVYEYETEITMGYFIPETVDLFPGKYRVYAGVYDDYGSVIEVYSKKCDKTSFTYNRGEDWFIGQKLNIFNEGLYGLDVAECSSSDETITTISEDGWFTLSEPGTVTVTGKTSKYTVSFTYGVIKPQIWVDKVELVKGFTWNALFEISGLPANVNTSDIKWSSSNSKIATVDKNGIVKGKKTGSVTIKGKFDKYTISTKVKVVENKYKRTDKINISSLDPSVSPVYGQVREMKYNSKGGLDVKFAILNVSKNNLKKVNKLSIKLYYRDKNYNEKVLTNMSFSNLKGVKKRGYTVYSLTVPKNKLKKQNVNLKDDTFWGQVEWSYSGTW